MPSGPHISTPLRPYEPHGNTILGPSTRCRGWRYPIEAMQRLEAISRCLPGIEHCQQNHVSGDKAMNLADDATFPSCIHYITVATRTSRSMHRASKPKLAACRRCRGQKLRCTWDTDDIRCQRCQRTNANCIVPSPKPMGRPPQSHREGSTPRHSQSRTSTPFRGAAEPLTPSASVVQDIVVPMDSLGSLSDPLDFLQW